MINYTWIIHTLSAKDMGDYSDVIYSAVFSKQGENEDGLKGVFKSAINFSTDDMTSSSTFTLFESITEDNIIGWIKAQFDQGLINNSILEEIELLEQNNRTIKSGKFPWDPVIVVPPVDDVPLTPEQIAEAENDQTDIRAGIGTTAT